MGENLLINLILSISVLFFLAKISPSLFRSIRRGKKGGRGGRKDQDLEFLITQQKAILSQSPLGSTSSSSSHPESLEKRYEQLYSKNPTENVKKILDLLKALQWGEGTVFHEIKSSFPDEPKPGLKDTIKAIRFIFYSGHIPLPTPQSSMPLPLFSEVKKLTHLLLMGQNQKGPWSVNSSDIQKGLIMLLKGHKESIFEQIKKREGEETFTKDWKDYAQMAQILAPIPSLNSPDDRPKALALFGLTEKSTKKHLKKRYQQLAKRKHPDLLSGKKASEAHRKQANENFANLKKAYDLLFNGP